MNTWLEKAIVGTIHTKYEVFDGMDNPLEENEHTQLCNEMGNPIGCTCFITALVEKKEILNG